MELSWKAWIEGAKNNEQDAFYALYQNSYDAVYRTVKSMVRDDDAALDIVQDSFVKGFENLASLNDPESFLPWMKRIATNKAKDWFKKKQAVTFSSLADEEGNEPDFEDDRTENLPEEVIDREETARLIEEILSTLSDEQRIAIGMFYYQQMSVAEIAEALDISENTVKSRLNYGRKKIKAGVEELEKKGTKLHSLTPIPFLMWLFRGQMAQATSGSAPAAIFGNIMAQSTAQAGAAAATTATAGGSGGLFSTLGAKIVAGVLAAAVTVGGTFTGVYLANRKDSDAAATPGVTDTDNLSDKERLTNFLEKKLIPQKGIYNIEQSAYYHFPFHDEIYRIDYTYNSETGELQEKETAGEDLFNLYNTGEYSWDEIYKIHAEFRAGFDTAMQTHDNSGLHGIDFYDYDGDSKPELLTVYGEMGIIYIELFDVRDAKVVSVGKVSFKDLDFFDETDNRDIRGVSRGRTADGSGYIMVWNSSSRFGPPATSLKYYHISPDMKVSSSLTIPRGENGVLFDYAAKTQTVIPLEWDKDCNVLNTDPNILAYREGMEEEEICSFYTVGDKVNRSIWKYYKKSGKPDDSKPAEEKSDNAKPEESAPAYTPAVYPSPLEGLSEEEISKSTYYSKIVAETINLMREQKDNGLAPLIYREDLTAVTTQFAAQFNPNNLVFGKYHVDSNHQTERASTTKTSKEIFAKYGINANILGDSILNMNIVFNHDEIQNRTAIEVYSGIDNVHIYPFDANAKEIAVGWYNGYGVIIIIG